MLNIIIFGMKTLKMKMGKSFTLDDIHKVLNVDILREYKVVIKN